MRNKKNKESKKTNQISDTQQFTAILDEVELYKSKHEAQSVLPVSSATAITQMIIDDNDSNFVFDSSNSAESNLGFNNNIVVNVGVASHIGTRKSQQDSLIIGIGNSIAPEFNGKFIAAVCDGMGGLQGGETASALCAKIFFEDFFSAPGLTDYPRFHKNVIDKIDEGVSSLRNEQGELMKAGSTFVSMIVDCGNLFWGCVGDSHMYIVRRNEIVQVNRDHNYMLLLKEQVKLGEISQAEAENNKHKDALISYMGMNGVKYMDVNEKPFRLLPNDTVVLCSDGLYRLLSDEEIVTILNSFPTNMNMAANAMVDAACGKMAPHQDNTSVIIFKYM